MGAPRDKKLRLYGARSDRPALAWAWVDQQLAQAGTYWFIARGHAYPHPRPVWGVWHQQQLHLSVGSPILRRAIQQDPVVTVHLDSGTDVVILEGLVLPLLATAPAVIGAYDAKYDWEYDVSQYRDLVRVDPVKIMAWRTAGPAGRESFQATGSWIFAHAPQG